MNAAVRVLIVDDDPPRKTPTPPDGRTRDKINLNNRTQIALLAHDAGLTG